MKSSFNRPSRRRTTRSDSTRRARILEAFDRSGLSAAAFARRHKVNYTTFCGWRQRRDKAKAAPGFVQVELSSPSAASEVVIELGAHARLRINAGSQIGLVAQLVQQFNATASC